ncbi:Ca-activated chloride channel family protein [Tistlia consotensis]|uniref:Ca-activated chloride channel family protein n=1 Tax=Tistlia consotensis USBA 355 TaxID=560819 RepID=A0A1Y6CEE0_9PROT|nr:VWA domain-containing protein [Tistlia consotensis]SMF51849.1 Ca-activated chloride channel family protein [Tistlia consotensis USBA 355]SNR83692.1 Ca-activated chloride channel family protein [Tistlia consotensis]
MTWGLAAPLALLLLPLPLLAHRLLPPAGGSGGALLVPSAIGEGLEARTSAQGTVRGAAARRLVPGLLWLCLVVALAGPRVVAPAPALPASGRDIVLALDLSGSMEQSDFRLDGAPVSRLAAVKRVAERFVRGRGGDRVGLVIFGETAFFAVPPTFDTEAVAQGIEAATVGIAGRSTAISDGLGLALKRLARSDAASRVVVLLSDGSNTSGSVDPRDAAGLAAELGVRIYTIALGPQALDDPGRPGDAVDVRTLKAIAEASGGTAFRVRTSADLQAVAGTIDALEPSLRNAPPTLVYRALWTYPAGLAFLLALGILLERVAIRLPRLASGFRARPARRRWRRA